MFDISLDSWQEILAAGLVLVTAGMVVVTMVKGQIILPGGTVLTLGRKPKKSAPMHASCPRLADFIEGMDRREAMTRERNRLEHETLHQQIRLFMSFEVKARDLAIGIFIDLLSKEVPSSSILNHPDYAAYYTAIIAVGRDVFDTWRIAMMENHLADKEGANWERYRNMKVSEIDSQFTSLLNKYYVGSIVQRAETYKANNITLTGKLNDALRGMFDEARRMAVECRDDCEKLKVDHAKWLKQMVTG